MAADLVAAGHQVSWLCEDRWSAVLAGSPVISTIHRLPRKLLRSGAPTARVQALASLARELRTASYDVVIDAQGLAKSAVAAWVGGAALHIGHARPRAREGAWLVAQRRVPTTAVHVIDQQRDLIRALALTPSTPWSFPLPAWVEERRWAAAWLAELPGASLGSARTGSAQTGSAQKSSARPWMLNVGAGWPSKVWPEERQIGLARAAAEQGLPLVVVWGSPAERLAAERIIDAADHGILAPPTTLPQLAGLLAQAAVVISGDTGPLHLALALGVPAVGLFGPVPAERNGPRGRGYRTLQAPGAAWERRDVGKGAMEQISVAAVMSAAMAAASEHPGSAAGATHAPPLDHG